MTTRPASPSPKALFVVFEGGDGSGKSTQVALLAEELRREGRRVVVTHQPGGTALGEQLRELVLHGGELSPRAEALLFAADKAQHVAQVIEPALARGDDVVSDRYVDSSIAYQGAGRDLGATEVCRVMEWAVGGLAPHLTVVLDVPVAVARRRRARPPDRVEAEPDGFHERVRGQFLDQASTDPSRYLVLDATRAPDQLCATVLDALVERGLLHRPSTTEPAP